jgi:hypothetical protein
LGGGCLAEGMIVAVDWKDSNEGTSCWNRSFIYNHVNETVNQLTLSRNALARLLH